MSLYLIFEDIGLEAHTCILLFISEDLCFVSQLKGGKKRGRHFQCGFLSSLKMCQQ
uniref:Uncharacterized protein n=1 Tax=Anguilla anguilla TaxID=7936 RepID=A0A0E9R292_ANGAN